MEHSTSYELRLSVYNLVHGAKGYMFHLSYLMSQQTSQSTEWLISDGHDNYKLICILLNEIVV